MNYSGHYLPGELFQKDKTTAVMKFKYAVIRSKSRNRDAYLQGVSSNQTAFQIEVVAKAGVFQREMYVDLSGRRYMIESIVSEDPINALNPKSLYYVHLELKR